jgi:excinuclease ABC subunit B
MPEFQLVSDFKPTGDQPRAIDALALGVERGLKHQVLLGVTGSGKTFTMAGVVARLQRPTLVIAHNKTLAAQLYAEFKEFFPNNAVEYFVSYYDYYQPEAYVPRTDTYIEKETLLNEDIDRMRHSAMQAVLTRRDTLIVASVSCIYGLGSPEDYGQAVVSLRRGERRKRDRVLRHLIEIYYERNDYNFGRGKFRVRGDTLEVHPAGQDIAVRIEFFGDEVERITEIDPLTGEVLADRVAVEIYPAKYFVTTREKLEAALRDIEAELEERVAELEASGRLLEAQRLRQRTLYDLEMLRETGVCPGVENYSRHLARRPAGSTPWTLLDYFPEDFLLFVDESHMSIPQVRGMFHGDRSRKQVLVDYGFRLPSALDNRPLMFPEFERHVNQAIYVSATPGPYELERARLAEDEVPRGAYFTVREWRPAAPDPGAADGGPGANGAGTSDLVRVYGAEQLIRPTGLLDPPISVRPTARGKQIKGVERLIAIDPEIPGEPDGGQIDDLLQEINRRTRRGERALVTTLTKRMAEDLADYLKEVGVKVHYLHSEIDTLERMDILRDLRLGVYDVVVGINLLREGLDLPEVSLVAILDADKEGYLRSASALIQTIGRAARHVDGRVIMYADTVTDSMERAIAETYRRRRVQLAYNQEHGITPAGIRKAIRDVSARVRQVAESRVEYQAGPSADLPKEELHRLVRELEQQMRAAAKELEFERAALLRDQIIELKGLLASRSEEIVPREFTRRR